MFDDALDSLTVGKHTAIFKDNMQAMTQEYLAFMQEECPRDAAFMNQINVKDIQFYWDLGMSYDPIPTEEQFNNCDIPESEDGTDKTMSVLGAWIVSRPNHIYMAPPSEPCMCLGVVQDKILSEQNCSDSVSPIKDFHCLKCSEWLFTPDMAETMVHELIHKFQFHTSPISYIFNRALTLIIDHSVLEKFGIEYDARTNSSTEELTTFYNKFAIALSAITTTLYSGPRDISANPRLKQVYDGIPYNPSYDKKYFDRALELTRWFC